MLNVTANVFWLHVAGSITAVIFFATTDVLEVGNLHVAAFSVNRFSMRQTCKPLYDHSQLQGETAPWGFVMQKHERATWLVLQAVLLLVLLQALRSLLLLVEVRPTVLRSPRPAHFFGLTFLLETDMHAFFIIPSQYKSHPGQ